LCSHPRAAEALAEEQATVTRNLPAGRQEAEGLRIYVLSVDIGNNFLSVHRVLSICHEIPFFAPGKSELNK